eukprot:2867343-Lingulodinium_polyedra.AAC.1
MSWNAPASRTTSAKTNGRGSSSAVVYPTQVGPPTTGARRYISSQPSPRGTSTKEPCRCAIGAAGARASSSR